MRLQFQPGAPFGVNAGCARALTLISATALFSCASPLRGEPSELPEVAEESITRPPAESAPPRQLSPNQQKKPALLESSSTPAPLCDDSQQSCAESMGVLAALERGDRQLAAGLFTKSQLSLSSDSSPEMQSLHLIVEGRLLLEEDSLAYGAGTDQSSKALSLFEKAILAAPADPLAPVHVEARLQRTRSLLSLGRGDDALPDLVLIARARPSDPEVQASLGIAYLSLGKTSQSVAPLARAAELDPTEPERLIVLGTARMLLGDLSQAERNFRGAVALDGSSARAHGNLGSLLLVQGNIDQGREHLRRASLLAPRKATYLSNLAYAELLSGNPRKALEFAQRALKLDKELASAWLNQGLAQVALSSRQQARDSFEKAQQLDPTDPRAKNNLNDLDELEKRAVRKAVEAD